MKIEASITGKRQITIPKELYNDMSLKNTDKLVFTKNGKGEIVVSKKEVNSLDICPVCNREVKNEDTMVVNQSQRYHISCWCLREDSEFNSMKCEYIANKLTKTQKETLDRVEQIKEKYILENTKSLVDNEVIISVPAKITFMESKPGVIGMISHLNSNEIMSCNKLDVD